MLKCKRSRPVNSVNTGAINYADKHNILGNYDNLWGGSGIAGGRFLKLKFKIHFRNVDGLSSMYYGQGCRLFGGGGLYLCTARQVSFQIKSKLINCIDQIDQ